MDFEQNEHEEEYEEFKDLINFFRAANRGGSYMLDLSRVRELMQAYELVKRIVKETDSKARIVCEQHERILNMGYIDVEAREFAFKDIEGFGEAARLASNIEIYPLEDNMLRMTLTFHGLMTRLD